MFFLNRQMFILSTLSVLRHFWLQPEPEVGANENEEKTHTGGSLINKEGWNCSVTSLQNRVQQCSVEITPHHTRSDAFRERLAVVISGLHFQDVGDDAVNLHVANEASEKQLLCYCCTYEPKGWETQQQLGQPVKNDGERGHGR